MDDWDIANDEEIVDDLMPFKVLEANTDDATEASNTVFKGGAKRFAPSKVAEEIGEDATEITSTVPRARQKRFSFKDETGEAAADVCDGEDGIVVHSNAMLLTVDADGHPAPCSPKRLGCGAQVLCVRMDNFEPCVCQVTAVLPEKAQTFTEVILRNVAEKAWTLRPGPTGMAVGSSELSALEDDARISVPKRSQLLLAQGRGDVAHWTPVARLAGADGSALLLKVRRTGSKVHFRERLCPADP